MENKDSARTYKFPIAMERGVLFFKIRRGMIGAMLQYPSTRTNKSNASVLIARGIHTQGFVQERSSEVLRLKPNSNPPTPVTKVKEPSQSIRRIFSIFDCCRVASGIGIWTRKVTMTADRMSGGI